MDFVHIIDEFANENNITLKPIAVPNFLAYIVQSHSLIEIIRFVKENRNLRFTILTDLFGADFPHRSNRFEITYSLLSLKLNKRLLLKIELDEDQPAPSITSIFSAACWYEREAFDMYGVIFDGCPDMRRILTDYGFVGHPLRKDFPLTGHLQVRYDAKLEQVIYEPVLLEQEFRNFDFSSPWQGPKISLLPGDEKATK